MKKIIFIVSILLFLPSATVFAINYPVSELGNCQNENECEIYCDDFSHLEKCLNFAEQNYMMTEAELKEARIVLPFLTKLNCNSEASCQAQCEKDENLMTCIELGYQLGEVSQKDYEAMKKTGGKGPGGCKMDECETYCNDDAHLVECVDFAVQTGIMDPAEAEIVKKTGTTQGPGGCKGKADCDRFCGQPENFRTCILFGSEHGLIDPDDAEIVLGAGSTQKEDIDRYCASSDEIHEKCQRMHVRKGHITEEQARWENLSMQFARQNCGITTWGWPAIEGCINNFCSQDQNIEKCWSFEISIGSRTQAEYDAWKSQIEENERKSREEAESQSQSQTQPELQPEQQPE